VLLAGKQSVSERIVFWGVVALLVFAPLAFGSVHVWAYTLIELGVFSLLFLYSMDRIVFSGSHTLKWVKTPINLFLVLLLALIGLQMLPVPSSWIAAVSPRTFSDKIQLFDVLARAKDSASEGAGWISLSYYTHQTHVELLKWAAYTGTFFLIVNTLKSKRQINALVYVLILVGLFESVYAIFQTFSETPRVWWWKSRVGDSRFASGTFVGSNHFAGFMEMLVSIAFGFVIAQKKREKRIATGLGGPRALVQRIVGWFAPESTSPKMIFLFFCAVLMGLALLLSASRSGILSIGASMLLISVLLLTKKRSRKYGMLSLGFCLVALFYSLHVGIDPTIEKFKYSEDLDRRLYTTRTMIPMLLDYSTLGVGWGNFRFLYPRYVPVDYDGVSSSGYSHNDWLEAGTEVGLVGGAIIVVGALWYLVRMIRIWRKRGDPHAIGIGIGVVAGLLSIGFHSYFDFNMHISANPLTLAALLGVGYAAIHRQGRGYQESFFYRSGRVSLTKSKRILISGIILFTFAVGTTGVARHFLAESKCPTEWNSTMNLNWNPYLTDIQKAIDYNKGNAEYHFKLAGYYMGARTSDEALRNEFNERAIASLEKAVFLNPARGIFWYDLGKRYSLKSYDPYGFLNTWLPLAEQCFDEGIRCAPTDSNMLFNVAWYWVWRSSLLPEAKGESNKELKAASFSREAGIKKFQQLFQRSLNLNSGRWRQAAGRIWEYYPDDAIVLGIVPAADEKLKSMMLRWVAKKET